MIVREAVARAMAGLITWKEAELIVGCTARHMRRLRIKCLLEGDIGEHLRDKRAGRKMPRRVLEDTAREIMHLRQTCYFDFNIKHFNEMLAERHEIKLSYTYVKRLLQTTGLAEKAKAKGKHRRLRKRRPMRGMMLQMDGSEHAWLGKEYGRKVLLTIMDDADSRVLFGRFVSGESTYSCLAAIQQVLEEKGLFSELYVDRASQFTYTKTAGEAPERGHTQIDRVLKQLRIRLILARSPQGKGRIERSYRTQQGRLPQELRDAEIKTWDDANRYIEEEFWPRYNKNFTIEPENSQSGFMPLVGVDLHRACALEHPVSVRPDNCVQWRKRLWQIPAHPSRPSFAKCKAVLVEYLNGVVDIEYGPMTVASFDSDGNQIKEQKAQVGSSGYALSPHLEVANY